MVTKYEILGADGRSWIQCGETEDRQMIQIIISEVQDQKMVTGIVLLSADAWRELMGLNYKLELRKSAIYEK
jgi:hypothetical protein